MQSLRMDDPDVLLMDDNNDDTDPFTARCMEFEVKVHITPQPPPPLKIM